MAIRFAEVQSFLTTIKEDEQPQAAHSQEINTKKGLFLVLLYSAFEYALSRSVIEYVETVNATEVKYEHIHSSFYAFVFDPQLTACSMAGREHKWQRRIDLFQKQISEQTVRVSEGAFLEQLENIWTKTVFKTFSVLGINNNALYDPRVSQYINEVVERRNAVAHGRESASVVGQAYTIGGLQTLNDELSRQTQYMMACFEQHLDGKHFIKEHCRNSY